MSNFYNKFLRNLVTSLVIFSPSLFAYEGTSNNHQHFKTHHNNGIKVDHDNGLKKIVIEESFKTHLSEVRTAKDTPRWVKDARLKNTEDLHSSYLEIFNCIKESFVSRSITGNDLHQKGLVEFSNTLPALYNGANWNAFFFVNYLKYMYSNKAQPQDVNTVIKAVRDKINNNTTYASYAKEINNAADDITKYVNGLKLHNYIKGIVQHRHIKDTKNKVQDGEQVELIPGVCVTMDKTNGPKGILISTKYENTTKTLWVPEDGRYMQYGNQKYIIGDDRNNTLEADFWMRAVNENHIHKPSNQYQQQNKYQKGHPKANQTSKNMINPSSYTSGKPLASLSATPQVYQQTKPSAQPPAPIHVVGLENPNNHCYWNALLQSLHASQSFRRLLNKMEGISSNNQPPEISGLQYLFKLMDTSKQAVTTTAMDTVKKSIAQNFPPQTKALYLGNGMQNSLDLYKAILKSLETSATSLGMEKDFRDALYLDGSNEPPHIFIFPGNTTNVKDNIINKVYTTLPNLLVVSANWQYINKGLFRPDINITLYEGVKQVSYRLSSITSVGSHFANNEVQSDRHYMARIYNPNDGKWFLVSDSFVNGNVPYNTAMSSLNGEILLFYERVS